MQREGRNAESGREEKGRIANEKRASDRTVIRVRRFERKKLTAVRPKNGIKKERGEERKEERKSECNSEEINSHKI